MEKNKKHPFLKAIKIIMLILTAVYPLTMVCMAGAGLIYNGDSYGSELVNTGTALIISGVLMTCGAVICVFKKTVMNIISLICTSSGLALCLVMLYKLCTHADNAGWTDNYTMSPVSDMYMVRILPVTVPAVLALLTAAIQIFSYQAAEERCIRRQKKLEAENASAPSIIEN